MDFQVETDVRMEFQKEVQELLGSSGIEVEGAVEHTDILDAVAMDGLQALADGFYGQGADRLLASAYAEGAGVEASSGSLQLHEWLAPVEEFARFGRCQLVEVHDLGQAIVVILTIGVQPTKSADGGPFFRSVPALQPLGKTFFAFASEYTVNERILPEEGLVVAQELRTAQDEAGIR